MANAVRRVSQVRKGTAVLGLLGPKAATVKRRKRGPRALRVLIVVLSLLGDDVPTICRATGATSLYVRVVRARARKRGLPVPRLPGHRGGGWARKPVVKKGGNERWRLLSRYREPW